MKMKFFYGLFVIALSSVSIAFAQKTDLREYKLELRAQGSPVGGMMADLDKGAVYNLDQAGYNPTTIDLAFMYGTSTGGNLIAPINPGITTYGGKFRDAMMAWGNDRNNGTFINLGYDADAHAIFDSIKSPEEIDSLHNEWYEKIQLRENYDSGKDGPGSRTRQIALGDVIFFKSEHKGTYHVMKITKYILGYSGTLELEVKSAKVEKKKKKKK